MHIFPVILLLCICAGLLAGVFIFTMHMHQEPTPEPGDGSGLKSISVFSGGDSLGGHYHLTLKVSEKGAVEIREEYQEAHNTKTIVRTASGDAELINKLEDIIRKNKIYAWKNLKDSGIYVLDAATTSYSFLYNGECVSFYDYAVLPKGGNEAVREIIQLITSYLS